MSNRRYDMGDEDIGFDHEKDKWLKKHFKKDDYSIINIGFIYDDYVLIFNNEKAEMLYVLRWS